MPPGKLPVAIDTGIMKAIAVWMQEDEDKDVEFEHEFVFVHDGKEDSTGISPFVFKGLFNRFIMTLGGFVVPAASTMYYFRSRIRKRGENDWLTSQVYPLTGSSTEGS